MATPTTPSKPPPPARLHRSGSIFQIPSPARKYVMPLLKPEEKAATKSAHSFKEDVTNVLVLYTGGTIGMRKSSKGYVPVENYFEKKLRTLPMFCDPEEPITTKKIIKYETGDEIEVDMLPLPVSKFGQRVRYCIDEYSPLLDSSDMGMEEWLKIAGDVERNYDRFDAFVILHGTDTMAYTSSALSFLFENLGKTVFLTGSQIPLSETRNDAVDNLQGCLTMAGHYRIPEVLVYFNNKVMRGNRVTKSDSESLDSFTSPQLPPIAHLGVTIKIDWNEVFHNDYDNMPFRAHVAIERHVGVLRLFPGITREALDAFLRPPMKGVVLETFGAGNAPSGRKDVLSAFEDATKAGIVIVNITQCSRGTVLPLYGVGQALVDVGVVPGSDMTVEAALCKLAYLLGKGFSPDQVREHLLLNMRGELTPPVNEHKFTVKDEDFVHAVAMALGTTSREESLIQRRIENMVLTSAAGHGNVSDVEYIANLGVDINFGDYDKRTALHLACAEGHEDVVRFLLSRHADVNVVDRFGRTPLFDALDQGNAHCADLLVPHGADLGLTDRKACRLLSELAADNAVERLEMYIKYGIQVNVQSLHNRRTPLHVAVATSSLACVKILLEAHASPHLVDFKGHTPFDEAQRIDECDQCLKEEILAALNAYRNEGQGLDKVESADNKEE